MTTFEHAMLGVTQVLATGLHRRFGWRIAALAGAAAAVPDWDGLTIVCGLGVFDRAHRAWGHNLLVCSAVGLVLAALDYRFDVAGRVQRRFERWVGVPRQEARFRRAPERCARGYAVWLTVGVAASLSHLPEDMVVSGAAQLTDWELPLLWPFSRAGFVYPLVPWGDPGVSLLLVAGMFGMWRWPGRLQSIAAATLLAVVAYLLARGMM